RAMEIGGSLQLESREGEGTSLIVSVPLAENGSGEIRRDLRAALIFAIIGYFLSGLAFFYSSRVFWPVVGAPVFTLNALGCYRAGRAIKNLKTIGATSVKKIWELEIYWRQVRAILWATLVWSAIQCSLISVLVIYILALDLPVFLFWLSFQLYEMSRIHRVMKLQSASYSPKEFQITIKKLWDQASLAAALVLPLWALLVNDPLKTDRMFGVSLVLYWLFVTCWRVWSKWRMTTARQGMKGNYDPSRVG